MNTDLDFFAKKLKILRQKRKLTLERLAELSDLTPNHISKLEAARSNPSFSSLSRIAEALEVELKDLFNFDDLKKETFIKEEFLNIIRHSSTEHLRLLYKIHRDLIN